MDANSALCYFKQARFARYRKSLSIERGSQSQCFLWKTVSKKDEAMLSYQTALYYAKIYGYDDVEKLLNQEISFIRLLITESLLTHHID